MNYHMMRQRDFLESELSELQRQEAETEYAIDYLPRTLKVNGKKQVIRLPRYIWVSFDRLVYGNAMSAERILEVAQFGAANRPHRTKQQNLENFIQYAIGRLGNYL